MVSARIGYLVLLCLIGCATVGLKEQQNLAALSTASVKTCKAVHAKCELASACVKRAQVAQKAIQLAQEARSKSAVTSDQEADAAGSYAAALACFDYGGWH